MTTLVRPATAPTIAYHYLIGLPYAEVGPDPGGGGRGRRGRPRRTASTRCGSASRFPRDASPNDMKTRTTTDDHDRRRGDTGLFAPLGFPSPRSAPRKLTLGRLHFRLEHAAARDGILDRRLRHPRDPGRGAAAWRLRGRPGAGGVTPARPRQCWQCLPRGESASCSRAGWGRRRGKSTSTSPAPGRRSTLRWTSGLPTDSAAMCSATWPHRVRPHRGLARSRQRSATPRRVRRRWARRAPRIRFPSLCPASPASVPLRRHVPAVRRRTGGETHPAEP